VEPLTLTLIIGAAVTGFGALVVKVWKATAALEQRRTARLDAVCGEVAERLQLRRPGKLELAGMFEGFRVHVEHLPGGDGRPSTKVVLSGERIAPGVRMARESAFSGVQKALSGEDVLIGQQSFDRFVQVAGPEDVVLAVLPATIRKSFQAWVGLGGTLKDGALTCHLPNDETGPERIPAALQELAGFAKAMAVDSVPAALQSNVERDPETGIRLRSLRLLVRDYSRTKQVSAALAAALSDADPEVVLFAAHHQVGAAAREALVKLVANTKVPEELRAAAVELLAQAHPWPAVRECMSKALYTRGATIRRAAVRAAGEAKDAALLDDLVSMLPTQDEDLAEALASAFQEIGGPRAEKALIELLATTEAPPALKAAAEALGRIGTIAAVEPLMALLEKGLAKDAARDAVRAIQARLGDVGAGRLSVVEPGAGGGALSLGAEAEGIPADAAKERG
jgi:hypothetical protein